MLCPFCFHLGMADCCRISGCWQSVPHKPATPTEELRKDAETVVLATALSLGLLSTKDPR